MPIRFSALVALLLAYPAVAQQAPAPAPAIPPEFADPANADRLANAMQALSKVFLDLPVGEVRAALEGRQPTAADRKATVRSETKMTEQQLRARISAAKPMLQQSMKALTDALPGMMQGFAQAQQSLERAAANMPDPNYPKR